LVTRWILQYSRQAAKDSLNLQSAGLKSKTEKLLKILSENPFQNPPSYEKLVGDMAGAYARRINRQHRLVYHVMKEERVVHVVRMWTHYE
jgi:Txe/YoeB family toxin of toxin-antitoxin system